MALQWDDLNLETGELNIRRQVYYVKGEMITSEPKTKSSIRTIILPKSVVKVLAELKKTVKSRWIFPSPLKEDMPRNPHTVYKKMQLVLERSGCKKIRFHDLRHTFATTALANGMDVKTLSAMIGFSRPFRLQVQLLRRCGRENTKARNRVYIRDKRPPVPRQIFSQRCRRKADIQNRLRQDKRGM